MSSIPHTSFLIPPVFLTCLNKGELEEIERQVEFRLFLAGEIIFTEGQEAKGWYYIQKGRVSTFKAIPGNTIFSLSVFKQGDAFGYYPLFLNNIYHSSGRAEEDTIAMFIKRDLFIKMINSSQGLRLAVLQQLAKECESYRIRSVLSIK